VSLFIRSRERAAAPERIASDVGYTYDPIASTPFRELSSFPSDRVAPRIYERFTVSLLVGISYRAGLFTASKNAINEREDCSALELIVNPDLSTIRLFIINNSQRKEQKLY
jgi:hypothetical protein